MPAALVTSVNWTEGGLPCACVKRRKNTKTQRHKENRRTNLFMGVQSRRNVFVNRLALVVVFGMRHAELTRDRLRGLIRLKTQIAFLMLFGAGGLSESGVAEHQVVMSLEVFRIDLQNLLKLGDGFRVFLLQE